MTPAEPAATSGTILLAIAEPLLRGACRRRLTREGHDVFVLNRPLAIVLFQSLLVCDLLCVDSSQLGREALTAARPWLPLLVLGLGAEYEGCAAKLRLPLDLDALASTVRALLVTRLAPTDTGIAALGATVGRPADPPRFERQRRRRAWPSRGHGRSGETAVPPDGRCRRSETAGHRVVYDCR